MLKAKFTTKRLVLYLIIGVALTAIGYLAGCHRGAATRPVTKQVVVLGFDGADPKLAAKWMAEGKLPIWRGWRAMVRSSLWVPPTRRSRPWRGHRSRRG